MLTDEDVAQFERLLSIEARAAGVALDVDDRQNILCNIVISAQKNHPTNLGGYARTAIRNQLAGLKRLRATARARLLTEASWTPGEAENQPVEATRDAVEQEIRPREVDALGEEEREPFAQWLIKRIRDPQAREEIAVAVCARLRLGNALGWEDAAEQELKSAKSARRRQRYADAAVQVDWPDEVTASLLEDLCGRYPIGLATQIWASTIMVPFRSVETTESGPRELAIELFEANRKKALEGVKKVLGEEVCGKILKGLANSVRPKRRRAEIEEIYRALSAVGPKLEDLRKVLAESWGLQRETTAAPVPESRREAVERAVDESWLSGAQRLRRQISGWLEHGQAMIADVENIRPVPQLEEPDQEETETKAIADYLVGVEAGDATRVLTGKVAALFDEANGGAFPLTSGQRDRLRKKWDGALQKARVRRQLPSAKPDAPTP